MDRVAAYTLLLILALFGIAETGYLIRTRRASRVPACPIGGGCHTVLSSRFNRLFGIHNDILGLLFNLVIAAVSIMLLFGPWNHSIPYWILFLALPGATAMSVLLVYLQYRVLRVWCFWCLVSAGIVVLMDAVVLFVFW